MGPGAHPLEDETILCATRGLVRPRTIFATPHASSVQFELTAPASRGAGENLVVMKGLTVT